VSSPLEHLDALERALVAKRFPPMSAWWRETIARFYESGRRQLVLRVGRRGGKSSTLCRVAVLEALYGEHVIPPGDVGIVGIVSVSRDEASQRLRTVKAILDVLGVKYRPIEAGLELVGTRVAFKTFTASIAGVVGGTWICAVCDEVSRWRDTETGANPAREVLGSMRPCLADQPNAKIFLSSAPMGTDDAHAVAFAEGETDLQCCAFAETWVARPSLTEAMTRAIERDPRIWAREYAAIPQGALSAAFEAELVDEAHLELADAWEPSTNAVYVIDAADLDGSENCEYAGGVARWYTRRRQAEDVYEYKYNVYPEGHPWAGKVSGRQPAKDENGNYVFKPGIDAPPVLYVGRIWGWRARAVSVDAVHDHIARECVKYGARLVTGDQHDAFANFGGLARRGLAFHKRAWNQQNKAAAISFLRRLMLDGRLVLDPTASEEDWQILRGQLLNYQERIHNGGLSYRAKAGLSDRASLLIVAALASMSTGTDTSLFGHEDPLGPTKPRSVRQVVKQPNA
jgi:hypothetical protein